MKALALERLNGVQFAELLGVRPKTLSAYVARGEVPPHDGRDPETGYKFWYRGTAERFRDSRPGGMYGKAVIVHLLISEIDLITNSELWDGAIAEILGVSERTVYRHRNSRNCKCLTGAP